MYNKVIFKRCFGNRGGNRIKNILKIPLYFKQMHFLIKYGYDPFANCETFSWFIKTMKSVLTEHKNNSPGYPASFGEYPLLATDPDLPEKEKKYKQEWTATLDRMITLLDQMDENNDTPPAAASAAAASPANDTALADIETEYRKREESKDEFFRLFGKYFYYLWC